MFPGPGAQIYRNEAGEPLGWDYPSDEPQGFDDRDDNPYIDDDYDEDEANEGDEPDRLRVRDDDAAGLADDVEHFYARNADHLDPAERALLANAVKLIRRFA